MILIKKNLHTHVILLFFCGLFFPFHVYIKVIEIIIGKVADDSIAFTASSTSWYTTYIIHKKHLPQNIM